VFRCDFRYSSSSDQRSDADEDECTDPSTEDDRVLDSVDWYVEGIFPETTAELTGNRSFDTFSDVASVDAENQEPKLPLSLLSERYRATFG
jgi:hypothetical protein